MARKAGLGRGLDSLLGEVRREVPAGQGSEATDSGQGEGASGQSAVRLVPIGDIRPHPEQPRRHFSEDALDELARSIASRGVIQPIVLRQQGRYYQIIAGERRWRAAQRARLHDIPAVIRDFSDSEALEIALIENIQREELNPIEEAEAYQRLVDEFGHKQAELARLVDKSRSHVANLLRLLDLPDAVREHVVEGRLTMGHARALITSDDAEEIAEKIIDGGLSVRQTERLVKTGSADDRKGEGRATAAASKGGYKDADVLALERQLGDLLGLPVSIEPSGNGDGGEGRLVLGYRTLDQLDMLCQRLTGEDF